VYITWFTILYFGSDKIIVERGILSPTSMFVCFNKLPLKLELTLIISEKLFAINVISSMRELTAQE